MYSTQTGSLCPVLLPFSLPDLTLCASSLAAFLFPQEHKLLEGRGFHMLYLLPEFQVFVEWLSLAAMSSGISFSGLPEFPFPPHVISIHTTKIVSTACPLSFN